MRRAWGVAGLLMLAACAGQPPRLAATRAIAAAGPSSLDYVVYASMADTALPLALAGYRSGPTERTGAVQLN